MPWFIRSEVDRLMANAHRKWAEARAEELGHSKDDPQTDTLGVAVWKPAFMAGYLAALGDAACPVCGALGVINGGLGPLVTCNRCNGTGRVVAP